VVLLVVVLLNEAKVYVNPDEIVALVQARDADDPLKHYAPEVRCVVQMANQQYTTREECAAIQKRMNEIKEENDDDLRP
jgi:hypothetical protein